MYRQYVQSGIAPGANTVTTSAIAANTIQPWQLSSSLLNPTVNSFTGDGTTTSFTLSLPPASANTVVVTVNGITQSPVTNYSTNNTSLVFTSAPSNASVIRAVQQAMIGTSIVPIDGSVTTSKLGSSLTLSGNTSFSGAISGTSATLSSLTASSAVATDASKGLVSVTNTGSGNNVLSASPTLTGTVAAASLSLSSLTSGRVPYATTAGLLNDSANLTFSGSLLDVRGSVNIGNGSSSYFVDIGSDSSNGYVRSSNQSTSFFIGTRTAIPLRFFTEDTEKMRITSAGLVGIGTTTPARVLELKAAQACMVFNDNTNVWTVGTGSFIDGSNSFNFYLGGVGSYLRIDASGNLGLGLGLVPNAGWASSAYRALQLGQRGVIMFYETGASVLNIGNNFYYDGTAYKRLTADYASQYQQATGAHNWRIAGTGATDSTISWTQAMTLDTSGNLLLGTTASNYRLNIKGGGSVGDSSVYAQFTTLDTGTTGNDGLLIGLATGASPDAYIAQKENAPLIFLTNNTERLRIPADAGGITFPATQVASSNANTLDDYEEGTWTPVLTGTTAVSYANQIGTYTKIGRLVTVQFLLQTNSQTYTNNGATFAVSGLIFPGTLPSYTNGDGVANMYGFTYSGYVLSSVNSTSINLTQINSNTAFSSLLNSAALGGFILGGTISYIAAT